MSSSSKINWQIGMRVKTDPEHEGGYLKIHGILVQIMRMQSVDWGVVYIPDLREGYAGYRSNHPLAVLMPTNEEPPGWIDPEWRRSEGAPPQSTAPTTGAGVDDHGKAKEEQEERQEERERQGRKEGGKEDGKEGRKGPERHR